MSILAGSKLKVSLRSLDIETLGGLVSFKPESIQFVRDDDRRWALTSREDRFALVNNEQEIISISPNHELGPIPEITLEFHGSLIANDLFFSQDQSRSNMVDVCKSKNRLFSSLSKQSNCDLIPFNPGMKQQLEHLNLNLASTADVLFETTSSIEDLKQQHSQDISGLNSSFLLNLQLGLENQSFHFETQLQNLSSFLGGQLNQSSLESRETLLRLEEEDTLLKETFNQHQLYQNLTNTQLQGEVSSLQGGLMSLSSQMSQSISTQDSLSSDLLSLSSLLQTFNSTFDSQFHLLNESLLTRLSLLNSSIQFDLESIVEESLGKLNTLNSSLLTIVNSTIYSLNDHSLNLSRLFSLSEDHENQMNLTSLSISTILANLTDLRSALATQSNTLESTINNTSLSLLSTLSDAIILNISSLESVLREESKDLALNTSNAIARTNSIFARAIGELKNSSLELFEAQENKLRNSENITNWQLEQLHSATNQNLTVLTMATVNGFRELNETLHGEVRALSTLLNESNLSHGAALSSLNQSMLNSLQLLNHSILSDLSLHSQLNNLSTSQLNQSLFIQSESLANLSLSTHRSLTALNDSLLSNLLSTNTSLLSLHNQLNQSIHTHLIGSNQHWNSTTQNLSLSLINLTALLNNTKKNLSNRIESHYSNLTQSLSSLNASSIHSSALLRSSLDNATLSFQLADSFLNQSIFTVSSSLQTSLSSLSTNTSQAISIVNSSLISLIQNTSTFLSDLRDKDVLQFNQTFLSLNQTLENRTALLNTSLSLLNSTLSLALNSSISNLSNQTQRAIESLAMNHSSLLSLTNTRISDLAQNLSLTLNTSTASLNFSIQSLNNTFQNRSLSIEKELNHSISSLNRSLLSDIHNSSQFFSSALNRSQFELNSALNQTHSLFASNLTSLTNLTSHNFSSLYSTLQLTNNTIENKLTILNLSASFTNQTIQHHSNQLQQLNQSFLLNNQSLHNTLNRSFSSLNISLNNQFRLTNHSIENLRNETKQTFQVLSQNLTQSLSKQHEDHSASILSLNNSLASQKTFLLNELRGTEGHLDASVKAMLGMVTYLDDVLLEEVVFLTNDNTQLTSRIFQLEQAAIDGKKRREEITHIGYSNLTSVNTSLFSLLHQTNNTHSAAISALSQSLLSLTNKSSQLEADLHRSELQMAVNSTNLENAMKNIEKLENRTSSLQSHLTNASTDLSLLRNNVQILNHSVLVPLVRQVQDFQTNASQTILAHNLTLQYHTKALEELKKDSHNQSIVALQTFQTLTSQILNSSSEQHKALRGEVNQLRDSTQALQLSIPSQIQQASSSILTELKSSSDKHSLSIKELDEKKVQPLQLSSTNQEARIKHIETGLPETTSRLQSQLDLMSKELKAKDETITSQAKQLSALESTVQSQDKKISLLEASLLSLQKSSASREELDGLRRLIHDLQSSIVSHSGKVLEVVMNSQGNKKT